jgi:Tol biopolymer transport system component
MNVTVINSIGNDTRPALSFDGTTLYFSTDVAGGLGGQDIYVCTREKARED